MQIHFILNYYNINLKNYFAFDVVIVFMMKPLLKIRIVLTTL